MNKKSDLWKNSVDKEGFTIVLHSCRTGRRYTDEQGIVIDPLSQKLSQSKEMKGVYIIAPDERDFIKETGEVGPQKTKFTDKYAADYLPGTKREQQGKSTGVWGNWNTFLNGEQIDQKRGYSIPEGKELNFWDKFLNLFK